MFGLVVGFDSWRRILEIFARAQYGNGRWDGDERRDGEDEERKELALLDGQ